MADIGMMMQQGRHLKGADVDEMDILCYFRNVLKPAGFSKHIIFWSLMSFCKEEG